METKKWLLLRSFESLFTNEGQSLWAEVRLQLHDHSTEIQCTAFYFLLKEPMEVAEEQHDEGRRDTLGILRKVLLLWYEVLKISSLSGMNSSIGSPVSNVRLINVQSTFNPECLIILQWHLQCIKGCSWHQYLGIWRRYKNNNVCWFRPIRKTIHFG